MNMKANGKETKKTEVNEEDEEKQENQENENETQLGDSEEESSAKAKAQ